MLALVAFKLFYGLIYAALFDVLGPFFQLPCLLLGLSDLKGFKLSHYAYQLITGSIRHSSLRRALRAFVKLELLAL